MSINNNSTSFEHSTLILVRGLPGSGKSYLTTNLAKKIIESYGKDTVVVLDPDETNYESQEYLALSESLSESGVDKKFHPYRFLRAKAHHAIKERQIFIWNQPFTHLDGFRKTITNLQNFASKVNIPLKIMIVEVNIPNRTAEDRVIKRIKEGGHGPSDNTFDKFKRDYESFADEGYSTVIVQGDEDVSNSTKTIMHRLERELLKDSTVT